MLAIVLALAASLSIGATDVLAGSQTRRTSLWTVLVFSQLTGVILIAVLVLARGQALPDGVLRPALIAGLLSMTSIAAYYQSLAIGVMGIVSPIVSLSVVVPVIVGLASGERPSATQLAGIVIALGGVLLATRAKSAGEHHQATSRTSVLLAALSAVTYGFVMVFYAQGAEADPYWTVVISRSASVVALMLVFAVMRPRLKLTKATTVPVLAVGLFSVSGDALFSVASTMGYLSIVSVLSSVYPVFVVILAYIFVHERLSRPQQLGVAAALVGVALIAAG